jgi:sucrose-phosphate synthase
LLKESRDWIGFGVATGRSLGSATEYLEQIGIELPDVIISSVGTEIYYGKKFQYGQGWDTHIKHRWNRDKIVNLLKRFPFLEYQQETNQRSFKISYNMKPAKDRLPSIHKLLLENRCRYNLIYSHEKYLDILPYRASKGKAIRYLSYKWEIPLGNFLVCGDSGNDEEMLRGEPLAVVVGNYSQELEKLKGARNVYFASGEYAAGILEGINHYQFIEKSKGR